MTAYTRTNRRKQPRRVARMVVDVQRFGRWGGWREVQRGARGLDFNRFGMAFVSRRRLRPGHVLRLSLHGPAMRLYGVRAHVVSSERIGSGYRTGVRFYESLRSLTDAPLPPALRYLGGLEQQLPESVPEDAGR